jgi:glycosyltransferase involved in cell wall biosynthesis
MNVMQLCSGTGLNGAVYSTLLTTRELAQRGHRVWLVCKPNSWISQQMASDPVELIWSDLQRWPLDELRRIAAIVREKKVDVIHTHQSPAHLFGVLLRWLFGVPCVATAHSCLFQLHWMLNDHVIAVSDAARRYHQTHNLVRRGRIATIYNFVDRHRLAEVPRDARLQVRASFGVEDGQPLLGVVGSVIPRKGVVYLVRALPAILRAAPGTRLIVVGRLSHGEYHERTRSVAHELGVQGNIIWAGQRDDALHILAATDVCVHPSLKEPLGRAVMEAMALGLPVVGTAVGGIPEMIVSGHTGILVPPADSEALADAVIGLLLDPGKRRMFGEAGRRRALGRFSPAVHALRTEEVYGHVLKRRGAA